MGDAVFVDGAISSPAQKAPENGTKSCGAEREPCSTRGGEFANDKGIVPRESLHVQLIGASSFHSTGELSEQWTRQGSELQEQEGGGEEGGGALQVSVVAG